MTVLTSVHSLASDRALQIHTGLEVRTDWLLRLCAQLELGKAQKFLVWTKIPVAAGPELGGIDPKMGRKKMLILPSFHTLPNTHSAHTASFPAPFSLNI